MAIKKCWVVMGMDMMPIFGDDGEPKEFTSEKAAIARAKEHVITSQDNEAWVFTMTHVVSRPDAEPDVEAVK